MHQEAETLGKENGLSIAEFSNWPAAFRKEVEAKVLEAMTKFGFEPSK
jgi:hypothetical protein